MLAPQPMWLPSHVFRACHWFEVRWIAAGGHAAKMVQMQTVGDRAYHKLVGQPVGIEHDAAPAASANPTIARLVDEPCP
jgi:hypothetical protein